MQTFLHPHHSLPSNQALLKILRWEPPKVVTPPLQLHRTCSLSRNASARNEKYPCFTLEHCLRFKIPSALLEEGQSLITSSTSLPHNARAHTHTHTHTHTHFLIAEQSLSSRIHCQEWLVPIKGMCFCLWRRVLSTTTFSGYCCVSLSLIVLRLPLCSGIIFPVFPLYTLHLPWIPSST